MRSSCHIVVGLSPFWTWVYCLLIESKPLCFLSLSFSVYLVGGGCLAFTLCCQLLLNLLPTKTCRWRSHEPLGSSVGPVPHHLVSAPGLPVSDWIPQQSADQNGDTSVSRLLEGGWCLPINRLSLRLLVLPHTNTFNSVATRSYFVYRANRREQVKYLASFSGLSLRNSLIDSVSAKAPLPLGHQRPYANYWTEDRLYMIHVSSLVHFPSPQCRLFKVEVRSLYFFSYSTEPRSVICRYLYEICSPFVYYPNIW